MRAGHTLANLDELESNSRLSRASLMRGRQLHFYLTTQDHTRLEAILREKVPFVAMRTDSLNGAPDLLASTIVGKFGEEKLGIYVCRQGDEGKVRFMPYKGAAEGCVDMDLSPVIQFGRGYQGDGLLRSGWLYYVPKYYDSFGVVREKDRSFLVWAERFYSEVRKFFRGHKWNSKYVGEHARESGYKLEE